MPTHLQVPFVAAVSAGWCVIMSGKRETCHLMPAKAWTQTAMGVGAGRSTDDRHAWRTPQVMVCWLGLWPDHARVPAGCSRLLPSKCQPRWSGDGGLGAFCSIAANYSLHPALYSEQRGSRVGQGWVILLSHVWPGALSKGWRSFGLLDRHSLHLCTNLLLLGTAKHAL